MDKLKMIFPHEKIHNDYFKYCGIEKTAGTARRFWTNTDWYRHERNKGRYIPQYKIMEGYEYNRLTYLVIELSPAKFLHGENLSSVTNDDLGPLVYKLIEFLEEIGIYDVQRFKILGCYPSEIAFGRNIEISDICSCDTALTVLNPFDYKAHAQRAATVVSNYKRSGKEIIFTIKGAETFKLYDKIEEFLNTIDPFTGKKAHKTKTELELMEYAKNHELIINGEAVEQFLRIELTLKTKRKIEQKLKPFLGTCRPTLRNLFNEEIWRAAINKDLLDIYDNPLTRFILLSNAEHPYLIDYIDKNFPRIHSQAHLRLLLSHLQQQGYAATRQEYLTTFKSRQTWYNYLKRLSKISQSTGFDGIYDLDNFQIFAKLMKKFEVAEKFEKSKLDFSYDCLNKKTANQALQ